MQNYLVDSSPLLLIFDILMIKDTSNVSAWILLFSLVCFSPLLAAKWLVGFAFSNDAKQIKTLLWPYELKTIANYCPT
jgi:hypothetical protein